MLGAVLSVVVTGFVIGALARFAVPGRDDMPIWKTILLGILGAIVGGFVAGLLGIVDDDGTTESGELLGALVCSLLGGVALLLLYRRFVQRRPLTGPDAR